MDQTKSTKPAVDTAYELELSGERFRQLVDEAARWLGTFLDTLPQQPASQLEDSLRKARTVWEPLPRSGQPFPQILRQLFEEVFPVSFNTAGPGYLAYIPGGGLPHSAIADLISLVVNRYVGMWSAAPVAAAMEVLVVQWLCELVGYDSSAGGFLTSGGSLATWAALILARETKAPDAIASSVVYTSTQAHHSVAKAAMLAGIPRSRFRTIEVDEQFRVRLDQLEEVVAADRREGLRPLAMIAQAGSTNTGAVDDLVTLSQWANDQNVWLHVDAAYGGFFLLTDRGRQAMNGIAAAHSVTLDPHKGLFLPYGTGCLVVQRREDLQQAFAGRGDYMTATAPQEFIDFCDSSPELTRDFRGLRIWLPLKMHGIEPFRQCLDEKLDLVQHATLRLRQIDGVEINAEPQLSIVAFRLLKPRQSREQLDRLNHEWLDRVNASKRVMLSGTSLKCGFVLRLCILSFRTHRDRIDECLDLLERTAREVLQREGA